MEYFTHLPEFQVLICKKCEYAVLPSYIDSHFADREKHEVGKRERQRIINAVAEIDGLIENEEKLSYEFQFPSPTSKPITALAKSKNNGMQCTFNIRGGPCLYICCSLQQIQEHCWEVHRWKSKNKGGRPRKQRNQNQEVPWRTGVHYQRFFKSGPKSGYFEVRAEEASPSSNSLSIASREDQFQLAKRELEAALRKVDEKEQRCI
jgi:Orsellinic acid/F9775 biosynthesis cluster protein D